MAGGKGAGFDQRRAPGSDCGTVLSAQDRRRGGGAAGYPRGHGEVPLLLWPAGAAQGTWEARNHQAMSCLMMMSLGVYVLGAADGAERARVEAHLPGCPACQAELMKLAPLPGLLAGLPDDMRAQPDPPGRTARRPAPAGTRVRPARRWRAIAAAACVAAAAGTAGGIWLTNTGTAPRPATVTLSGTN